MSSKRVIFDNKKRVCCWCRCSGYKTINNPWNGHLWKYFVQPCCLVYNTPGARQFAFFDTRSLSVCVCVHKPPTEHSLIIVYWYYPAISYKSNKQLGYFPHTQSPIDMFMELILCRVSLVYKYNSNPQTHTCAIVSAITSRSLGTYYCYSYKSPQTLAGLLSQENKQSSIH